MRQMKHYINIFVLKIYVCRRDLGFSPLIFGTEASDYVSAAPPSLMSDPERNLNFTQPEIEFETAAYEAVILSLLHSGVSGTKARFNI